MILIDLDDKKIWNKALENEEHLIGHSWDYSKFLSINDKNLKPHLLIFDEINKKNFCAVNICSYKDFRYIHSLSGYTGYSQFFSKDEILLAALNGGHHVVFSVGLLVAAITAFYMYFCLIKKLHLCRLCCITPSKE